MNLRLLRALLLLLLVVLLALIPLLRSDDLLLGSLLDTAGTYAIVTVGLNLLSGTTGQFSLGHAGFYAIGAFTSALLTTTRGWPFWLDVPAAGLLAGIAGVALGLPALRLSGPYLAIATLSFGLLVFDLLRTTDWVGGRTGIAMPAPTLGSVSFSTMQFFWIILLVLVLTTLVVYRLRRSATGRAFVALRDSEPAAQASGVNLARYRVLAFALSASYAGLAGGLYAHWAGYISADSFGLNLSISFVAMIVVGGLDSIVGSILGALLLTLLAVQLQDQAHLADTLYGAILVVVLLLVPGGLMGLRLTLPPPLRRRPHP